VSDSIDSFNIFNTGCSIRHPIKIAIQAIVQVCFIFALTHAFAAESEPAAKPYRPTLSNPADLSVPGWLELEFGTQRIKGGEDKWRDSYPVLAKLAFSENWGVLLGSELAVQRTDISDQVFKGNGDTLFVIKHRIPTATDGSAFGIELGYKSPTANDTIGSGQPDQILNGIYSTEIAGHDIDLNIGVTHVGGVADGIDANLYSWAVAAGRNLNEQWGVFGELSGTGQQGNSATSQFMAGCTYNLSKRVVLDAGASAGLTPASQEWTLFAGVTALLGKVW